MRNKRLFIIVVLTLFLSHVRAQEWMTVGPYLQELTTDGVTVVYEHGIPSVSWIEVREKGSSEITEYYQTVNGRVKAYSQILNSKNSAVPVQNFAVRAEGLKPATTYEYRIKAHKVLSENSNGVSAGTSFSGVYTGSWYQFTTQDPHQSEHHLFITSDMHNRPDTLEALLKYLDYQTCDRIIYNGDMINYMQHGSQEPYKGFINTSVNLFAKNKPFEYLRGNHETRGDMSRHIMEYFPRKSGNIYNAYRWGDLEVVLLDGGEALPDDNPTARNTFLAAYNAYRREEAQWLEQLIQTEEYQTAKYRIVVSHLPIPNATTDESQAGAKFFADLMTPILNRANVDLLVCGHLHPDTYTFLDATEEATFPTLVQGYNSALRMEVAEGKITLKVVDENGTVLLEKTL